MFKMGLLTSSAMTAVALLLSGAPTGSYAQTNMHFGNQDPNSRFLCTYGGFAVSSFSSGPSYSSFFSWKHVAVPVMGQGQTVSLITVAEKAIKGPMFFSPFSVGIYSNAPSGFPGKLIAGASGWASASCRQVNISIPPTRLKPHTKYWIEEKAGRVVSSTNLLHWMVNPKAKQKAYVQTHRASGSSGSCCYYSHTSRWRKKSQGPWFKLK